MWFGGRPYPCLFRSCLVGCRFTNCGRLERSETHDLSPDDWDSRRSVCVGHPKDSPDERMQHSACVQTSAPEVRASANTQILSAAGPSPVFGPVDIPEVGWVETIQLSSPPRSGQLSPESPQMIAFEEMGGLVGISVP